MTQGAQDGGDREVPSGSAPSPPDAASEEEEIQLEEHPDSGAPDPDLAAARAATAAASDVYRRLWVAVVRWPLRNGTVLAVVLLAAIAAGTSWLEGGATGSDRQANFLVQAVLWVVAFALLAIYARRVVHCTVSDDRPVPWFRDHLDHATILQSFIDLVQILGVLLIPVFLWWLVAWIVEVSPNTFQFVQLVLVVLAAAQFPLALAAATARDDIAAALPTTTVRMYRAAPHAARVAAGMAILFGGLLAASLWLAGLFNPGTYEATVEDHTFLRDAGRVGLFALRFVGFYAALVAFRVSGLLVREVPGIREAVD